MIMVLDRGFQNVCIDVPDKHYNEAVDYMKEARKQGVRLMALQLELAARFEARTVGSQTWVYDVKD